MTDHRNADAGIIVRRLGTIELPSVAARREGEALMTKAERFDKAKMERDTHTARKLFVEAVEMPWNAGYEWDDGSCIAYGPAHQAAQLEGLFTSCPSCSRRVRTAEGAELYEETRAEERAAYSEANNRERSKAYARNMLVRVNALLMNALRPERGA